jgi:hypothetical protein
MNIYYNIKLLLMFLKNSKQRMQFLGCSISPTDNTVKLFMWKSIIIALRQLASSSDTNLRWFFEKLSTVSYTKAPVGQAETQAGARWA